MIRNLGQKHQATLQALVSQHLDLVYDLIFQVLGQEEATLHTLQKVLRTAKLRYKRDRVEQYAKLWLIRITVEKIQSSYAFFLSEQEADYVPTLAPLSLEEKLCVLLKNRAGLALEDIAAVIQLPTSRAGRSLVYGQERLVEAWNLGSLDSKPPLPERVAQHISAAPAILLELHRVLAALPRHSIVELGQNRSFKLLAILATSPSEWSWKQLNWKFKLAIESVGFAVVGALVVIALPWMMARFDTKALIQGRFSDVVQLERTMEEKIEQPLAISADRLIASSAQGTEEALPLEDEFSNVDFPSGDNVEVGPASLAPSRQNAAVYRLIMQSPSPRELIGDLNTVFSNHKVHMRDLSGKSMPGGVYFDGVTTQGQYASILQSVKGLKQVGQPRTYGNAGLNRNPNERARVIVWVQQI